jgi:hypothetical protein
MNIGRVINFTVYGDVRQIRETLNDALNNTLDVSVYDEIDDNVYASVWDIFDGGLIASVEGEIWDYEYAKTFG